MKLLKVILAAVLIFVAGGLCGLWTAQWQGRSKGVQQPVWTPPPLQRVELLRRAAHDIGLTGEQLERIDTAAAGARKRLRELMQPITPVAREELRLLQTRVMSELSPEQRRRFDDWLAGFRSRFPEQWKNWQQALQTNTPPGKAGVSTEQP